MTTTPNTARIRQAIFDAIELKATKSTMEISQHTLKLLNMKTDDFHAGMLVIDEILNMFRLGLVSPYCPISNVNFNFIKITADGYLLRGRLAKDPYSAAEYMTSISGVLTWNPAALSYVDEAVQAINHGLYRAAAVLIGVATETLVEDLRDTLAEAMESIGLKPPRDLRAHKIKDVTTALWKEIKSRDLGKLSERLDAAILYVDRLRLLRNDAGHPRELGAIAAADTHANFIFYADVVEVFVKLREWINETYKPL